MNTQNPRCRLGVILGILAAATLATHALAAEKASARRPNIIVILSDDQGYADVGYQGCKDIPTPNIDTLAGNGVRFSSGYVSCPVCSPTRAGLMTGRYQQRFGHEFNPGPGNFSSEFGLPLDQVTIADRLKAAGYVTGMVGKWHLGFEKAFHPLRRGFGEFFGFPAGAHDYFRANVGTNNPILRGYQEVDEKDYLTDAFAREAVAFVDRHAKEPFFLYLAFNAVHAPLQAPDKYLKRFSRISDERRLKHAAMVSAMDDAVGALTAKVRDAGLEQDTLIFFLSDNGGPTLSTTSSNVPLRGYKGQVLEGGIRVPFVVQWKGRLPAGKTFEQPVISLDILPTAVAAAGGTLPTDRPIDGVNLLPYLTGKETKPPHEALFWRFGAQAAVRKGDWKLVRFQAPEASNATATKGARAARKNTEAGTTPVQLYNLANDISEEQDLASKEPEKLKELQTALDTWESQLAKPRWQGKAKAKFNQSLEPGGEGSSAKKAAQPAGRKARARRNRAQ